jgi:hypothetical protein
MVPPQVFGEKIWDSMFLVALGYPSNPTQNDVVKYRTYYILQGNVLPCPKCCFNFNGHLQKFPLDDYVLESRNNLIWWLYQLKNEVNKMIGKPMMTENELDDYLYILTTPSNQPDNYQKLLIIIVVVTIFIYCLKKN